MTVALRQEEALFTFDDFVRMADDGYFGQAKHLELIDGRIYALSPVSLHHLRGQARLMFALDRALGPRLDGLEAEVVGPGTLRIDALNGPEFDAAVLKISDRDYAAPGDALLVAEVMLSSRNRDLRHKPPVYAAAGVPEYWALDLRKRRLHVFREPSKDGYRQAMDPLGEGDFVYPLCAPDVAIPVADLL